MAPLQTQELVLGQLLERSQNNGQTLARIDTRLESMSRDLSNIAERTKGPPPVPPIERHLKRLAQYLLPLLVLWATGSVEQALEALKVLK